jgi:hypothetical protein
MKTQATEIKAGMKFKYGNTPAVATSDAYTIGNGTKDVFIDYVDLPHTIKHRGVPPMVSKGGNKGRASFRASTMVEVR